MNIEMDLPMDLKIEGKRSNYRYIRVPSQFYRGHCAKKMNPVFQFANHIFVKEN